MPDFPVFGIILDKEVHEKLFYLFTYQVAFGMLVWMNLWKILSQREILFILYILIILVRCRAIARCLPIVCQLIARWFVASACSVSVISTGTDSYRRLCFAYGFAINSNLFNSVADIPHKIPILNNSSLGLLCLKSCGIRLTSPPLAGMLLPFVRHHRPLYYRVKWA